ncbi:MAG: hypothetical protein IPM57_10905 [Oligoflexia bacterium]|nr:hypothetical protein [Oligoflexia bacterium]
MKSLLLLSSLFLASTTYASGFTCTGQGFNVQMYNNTQPAKGIHNPAVLVVSHQQHGTLAVLRGDEIQKWNTPQSISYSGQTNAYQTGRFVFAHLFVSKQPLGGANSSQRAGNLTVRMDKKELSARVVCERYLKHN